jgi:hypothetical protein
MHILKTILLILSFLIWKLQSHAQAPDQFNYQGIARNASGAPVANQTIKMRLKIHRSSTSGAVEYSETRTVTTNAFGLFTIAIGSPGATDVSGTINSINWSNTPKFLQVEMDGSGGNNFIDLGTTQLLSVPYALQTKKLALPFKDTVTSNQPAFEVNNNGSGPGIVSRKGQNIIHPLNPESAIAGQGEDVAGIVGFSEDTYGVYGESATSYGVYGISNAGGFAGVSGKTETNQGVAVEGIAISGGTAGHFLSMSGKALVTNGKIEMQNTGETAGKVLMTNSSGNAKWEGGIAFSAFNHTAGPLEVPNNTEVTVPFDGTEYDLNNNFILSTSFINPSTFTAPAEGIYHFDAFVKWNHFSNGSTFLSLKKGANLVYTSESLGYLTNHISIDIPLGAGTKVTLSVKQISNDTQYLSLGNSVTRFSGRFVSKF